MLGSPWWVNLVGLAPIVSFLAWRRTGLRLSSPLLIYATVFAAAFGVDEAVVVVYLRGAVGLLSAAANPDEVLARLPNLFSKAEVVREASTILMLVAASLLAVGSLRERWGIFLWMFALWDIFYYAGLWLLIGWPSSLLAQDVLFLIPTPWVAQVWFPVLISLLAVGAVLLASTLSPLTGDREN